LTHQVMCLAMLFDMHFDEDYEKRKVTSVIDVGLCKPVSGTMLQDQLGEETVGRLYIGEALIALQVICRV